MIEPELGTALVGKFGTPLYVYDLDRIEARVAELRSIVPQKARIYYSMKANPLPAVAEAARLAGTGAEISSAGELSAALLAGFAPQKILYTGPAKTPTELSVAMRYGVRWFSAESLRDMERINVAAASESARAQVLLRINPAKPPHSRLAMAGVPSPFGFDEDAIESLAKALGRFSSIDIAGAHIYLGTQAEDAHALSAMFRIAIETADQISSLLKIRFLDLGGGFPWPFAQDSPPPDLNPLSASLVALTTASVTCRNAELWFESGRYIAASSGTLIARVMDVKESHGVLYYILDAGIAHLGGMSALGRVLRPAASLLPLDNRFRREMVVADIAGPLCTTLDCLARRATVPELRAGELVAIPNVGAYGATASLLGFLSRPTAVEVSLRHGRVVDAARLRAGHESLAAAGVSHG
jgi:diaminopimelate decarboxylase